MARRMIKAGLSEQSSTEIAAASALKFEGEPWLYWDSTTQMFLSFEGLREARWFDHGERHGFDV